MYVAQVQYLLRALWLLAAIPIVGIIQILMHAYSPTDTSDYLTGVTTLAIGIGLIYGLTYGQARAAMKNPSFQKPLMLSFSKDGVELSGAHAAGRVDWVLIKGAFETKRFIFVKQRGMFYLVPKAQITPSEVASIRDLLRSHLPGKVKLRRD